MKRTAVIVGALEDEDTRLRAQVGDVVDVLATELQPENGLALVRDRKAEIALLFLDNQPEDILSVCREIHRTNGCAQIMVSRQRNPDAILEAMRAGALDFAHLETGDEVRRAVLKAAATIEAPSELGRVIVVFSTKGGSGATTIACNLAGALLLRLADPDAARPGHRGVVVADMDFQMGDVLAFLDLTCRYTWKDLIGNLHRLDGELLFSALTTHACGLRVVSQADQPEEADEISPQGISGSLALLRRHFGCVVVDGVRDFREGSLQALDCADTIVMTVTQDVPALKNANRSLSVLRRLGYDRAKIKVVLNRFTKRHGLAPDEIADALGGPVDALVSNDFPTVVSGINEGRLLTENRTGARVTRDIRSLIPLVLGEKPRPERRGLLSLLRRS